MAAAKKGEKLKDEIKNMFAQSDRKTEVDIHLGKKISNIALSHQHDLNELGYSYNADGYLRDENDKPFKFRDQKHYEELGDAVERYIQYLLQQDYDLQEVLLPLQKSGDPPPPPAVNNIFVSENAQDADVLVMLIQGSGAVRAGQWARSVNINDSLAAGSILPYLHRIHENGWGAIVLNPNLNSVPDPSGALESEDEEKEKESKKRAKKARKAKKSKKQKKGEKKERRVKRIDIEGSETQEDHTIYVYNNFVAKSKASHILIIAHSYGGSATKSLLNVHGNDLKDRLRAIAFTDSVHMLSQKNDDDPLALDLLKSLSRNWVCSDDPLDTIDRFHSASWCVSSGHTKHVYTSASAMSSVFPFLQLGLSGNLGKNIPPSTLPPCPDGVDCEAQFEDYKHSTKSSHPCPMDPCSCLDDASHIKLFVHATEA